MNDCHPELLTAISNGNEQSLAQLYHLFHARLVAFYHTIVHSTEIAEEVVEDVFIKLWRNRQQLAEVENISVYLYVATKNTSLNAIAGKARQLLTQPFDSIDFQFVHSSFNPYDQLVSAEMQERMRQAIDQLPPRCKMIFKLVREDGLKYKEVSAILNISVNTIDAQMAIAVKRIAQALQLNRNVHPKK